MIFNSLTFILICLIPSTLCILCIEKIAEGKNRIKLQNAVLLLFSLLFFAWSGTQHIKVLLFLIFANYIFGCLKNKTKGALLAGVAVNLAVLIYFKYPYQIAEVFNRIFEREFAAGDIIAPLGISFIVFQSISYLMDLYNDRAEVCTNFLDFALYMSFFPKLSQGPIVKYQDMAAQLKERAIRFDPFVKGVERFIIGASKKVLVGDVLADTYNQIFYNIGAEIGVDAGTAWIAVISYAFGLYMDFSGYSDMAIGMASMYGFEFKENFDFPYLSTSITEFWRRWHISLGAWFREYLYFPLGGSRKGNVYVNLFLVFLATGVWHGSGWVYFLWGALHGVCVVIERYIMKKSWYEKIPVVIRWAATFLIVSLGWVAFYSNGIEECLEFLSYLIGQGNAVSFSAAYFMTPKLIFLWVTAITGTVVFSRYIVQERLIYWNENSKVFNVFKYIILLGMAYLCFITTVSEGYTPFLYFQF